MNVDFPGMSILIEEKLILNGADLLLSMNQQNTITDTVQIGNS